MITNRSDHSDRLSAWCDGSAICVIAVSRAGDPLDLSEHEVEAFVAELQECLAQSLPPDSRSSRQPITPSLQQSWAVTLRHLAASRFYLPAQLPTPAALEAEKNMVNYLHHKELGLALSEAEAIGNEASAPSAYWQELALAAKSMNLAAETARLSARNDA